MAEQLPSLPRAESPILQVRTRQKAHSAVSMDVNVVYTELRLVLKKEKQLSRSELKYMQDQVNKMEACDIKKRLLISKIKGILSLLLKKSKDFRADVANDDIVIFKRSEWRSSAKAATPDLAEGGLLTNNNFVEATLANDDEPYNSTDLFSESCMMEALKQPMFILDGNSQMSMDATAQLDVTNTIKHETSMNLNLGVSPKARRLQKIRDAFDKEQTMEENEAELQFEATWRTKWLSELTDKIAALGCSNSMSANDIVSGRESEPETERSSTNFHSQLREYQNKLLHDEDIRCLLDEATYINFCNRPT